MADRPKNYRPQSQVKTILPSFPLSQLPNELLTPIINKMSYRTFINSRMSSRWIHDFIKELQINVLYRDKIVVLTSNGITCGGSGRIISRPLEELKVIRPRKVEIKGIYTDTREDRYLETEKLKKMFADLRELKWQNMRITLFEIQENDLFMAFDELLEDGIVPTSISIRSSGDWIYNSWITQHRLFSVVPIISIENSYSPDLAFLLQKHTVIRINCGEICTKTVNKMLELTISGSLPTERVWINFYHPEGTPMRKGILEGLPVTLLWSFDTRESSILNKRFPNMYPPSEYFYYMLLLADGRVAVLLLNVWIASFLKFWAFPNEEELFHRIGRDMHLCDCISASAY